MIAKSTYLCNDRQIVEFRPITETTVLVIVRTSDVENGIYGVHRSTLAVDKARNRFAKLRSAGYQPW
jgi:hypothetical protein